MNTTALPDFDRLWDYHDPAATEAKFRQLLPLAQKSGDVVYRAQLLTQIARSQGLQRRFDDAHATLDSIQSMLREDHPLPRVRCLLERGRVLNFSGDQQEAKPLFEQAFELAVEHVIDAHAIDCAHMLAIVDSDPQRKLDWNLRALKLAENSTDERARKWRASLYNNIGWTYFDQKNYDKALEIFEKAVLLRTEAGKQPELRIARYCIAKTLRMMGQFGKALNIVRTLHEECEHASQPDGYILEELAECLHASDRPDEARPLFRQAHAELSRDAWLVKHEPDRLERLRQLGTDAV